MDYYSKGGNVNSYEIRNLTAHTDYHLSISADNNYGFGPPASMRFRTAEDGKSAFTF